jgi:hypothetical protein
VVELCEALASFAAFAVLMADYSLAREPSQPALCLQGSRAALHAEEEEGGAARPDLDGSLAVTSMPSCGAI